MTWTEELVSLMKNETIEKLFSFKSQYIPEKLYKYRAVNDFSIYNLESDTVWLSSPLKLNDPYDSSMKYDHELLSKMLINQNIDHFIGNIPLKTLFKDNEINEIKQSEDPFQTLFDKSINLIDNKIKNADAAVNVFKKIINDFVSQNLIDFNVKMKGGLKISCFSETVDSIPMWGHYADSHKGFCVEYNLKNHPLNYPPSRFLYPVIYSDEIADVTDAFKNGSRNVNVLFPVTAAMHKGNDWSYEKEWRMIFSAGITEETNWPVPTPSAVYLGKNMSLENKDRIISICNRKSIVVHQMETNPSLIKLISTHVKG